MVDGSVVSPWVTSVRVGSSSIDNGLRVGLPFFQSQYIAYQEHFDRLRVPRSRTVSFPGLCNVV